VTYIPLAANWHFHPDSSVDLAVLPWAHPQGGNYTCVSQDFDEIVTTPEFLKQHGASWPPCEGADVIFAGLMEQHIGIDRNVPLVRRGHIACITDDLIVGEYGPSTYHLIDMQVYPGHSGGPVWVLYGTTLFLLGLVAAGYPVEQRVMVKKTTKKGKTRIEKTEYINLGISLVVPSWTVTDSQKH
jgi:hypothetical protein